MPHWNRTQGRSTHADLGWKEHGKKKGKGREGGEESEMDGARRSNAEKNISAASAARKSLPTPTATAASAQARERGVERRGTVHRISVTRALLSLPLPRESKQKTQRKAHSPPPPPPPPPTGHPHTSNKGNKTNNMERKDMLGQIGRGRVPAHTRTVGRYRQDNNNKKGEDGHLHARTGRVRVYGWGGESAQAHYNRRVHRTTTAAQ